MPVLDYAATNDDWYTPPEVFQALGLSFDLDVASTPDGIPWIPTTAWYSVHDDGLSQQWTGLVWCNPPFSRAKDWSLRFIDHGDGVLLASIPNDTRWFTDLYRGSALVYFGDRGWSYHRPDGKHTQNPWPTMMAAMGDEAKSGLRRLASVFPGVLTEQHQPLRSGRTLQEAAKV